MDRDRDRDRSRQIKRPKTSTSSESSSVSRHHSRSERDVKPEEKIDKAGSSSNDDNKPFPINKKDLHEKIFNYELEEAKSMDISKTLDTYSNVLANLEENIAELFVTRQKGGLTEEEKTILKTEGINYILSLKSINRLLKYRLKSVKDDQFTKRMKVDTEHLKLQNLLYEATNLQNQVAAVQDYKSMDEKIDLIPVEQFYKESPQNISKPEVTKSDPHLLRIARLEYEFIQRQKLTEKCTLLEKEKEAISKNIEEKQSKLESVGPLLKKVLESTLPVQEFFSLDISAKKARNEMARFLPTPLFVLFVQSEAYQESPGGKKYFKVKLAGDAEAAKDLVEEEEELEEDSDRNNEPDAEEVSERRSLRKRSSIGVSLEENRKRVFQKHPLWIEWTVQSKGSERITLCFYYIPKLKIVTVVYRLRHDSADGTSSTSLSSNPDSILDDLYDNDIGAESPNLANLFILNKLGVTNISSYLKDLGKPYVWVQKVCGIQFPEQASCAKDFETRQNGARKMHTLSCSSLDDAVKRIRKRLTNRSKLWSQLKNLESRSIVLPAAVKESLPQKNAAHFVSWESISFETYCAYDFSESFRKYEVVSAKDTFFKAIFQRGTAKLTALIALKSDFPVAHPLICIQLDMEGNLRNAKTDKAIKDIEREVNMHVVKEFPDSQEFIISIQLHRLMTCWDVILESATLGGESEGPLEFSREKLMLRTSAGRNIRGAFKYINQGGGYYTQHY